MTKRLRQSNPFNSDIYVIEHRRNTRTHKRYIFANDFDSDNLLPDLEINLNYASIFTHEEMVYMVNLLEINGTPLSQIKVKKVQIEEITLKTIIEAKESIQLSYLIGKVIPSEEISSKLPSDFPRITLFYNKLKEKTERRSGTLFNEVEVKDLMDDTVLDAKTVIIKL